MRPYIASPRCAPLSRLKVKGEIYSTYVIDCNLMQKRITTKTTIYFFLEVNDESIKASRRLKSIGSWTEDGGVFSSGMPHLSDLWPSIFTPQYLYRAGCLPCHTVSHPCLLCRPLFRTPSELCLQDTPAANIRFHILLTF